jgi:hypothetical protein
LNYTLEVDIFTGYEDIDPFADGSCVYYAGRDNQIDLVSGDSFTEPPYGWRTSEEALIPGRYGKIHRPARGVRASNITSTDALENMYKNIYVQFDRIVEYNDASFTTLFTIRCEDDNSLTKFGIYERFYNNETSIQIKARDGDSGSAIQTLFEYTISTGFENSYGSIAIIETSDDSGSYRVLINGTDVGGFDFTMTVEPSSSAEVYINAQYENTVTYHTHCRTMIFNRPLTVDNVKYLDDKLAIIKG